MASESGIVRVNKSSGNYFIASNEPFNDERLSWEARGVMGYLLSKPDGWEIKEKDLIKKGPAKLHKITRVIKELKAHGYIQRYRVRRPGGTFDWVSEVFESPSANPDHKEKEPTLAELESAFPEQEDEPTTSRKTTNGLSTNGLSTNGLSTHGKSGYIVSTEGASTNRVITEPQTTLHIEKSNVDFSRVSQEHPQAQQPSLSLDGLSVPDAENGSQHEKAKKPRAKKAPTGNPNTQPILSAYQQAYEAHTGFSYTFPGFDKKAAKTLADAGYTPEQVVAAYKDLCSDPWWSKRNNISLLNVSTEIGGILKKLGYSPSRDGSSVPYQAPKPNYLTPENLYA